MFILLGLWMPVVVEVFCRKGKKKVIKKNELKMIHYSSLHRQGIASRGSGLHWTLQGGTPKSSPDLSWQTQPGLACLCIIGLLNDTRCSDITCLKIHKWLLLFQHLLPFFASAHWIRSTLLGQMMWSPPAFCCPLVLRGNMIHKNKHYGGATRTFCSFSTKVFPFWNKIMHMAGLHWEIYCCFL